MLNRTCCHHKPFVSHLEPLYTLKCVEWRSDLRSSRHLPKLHDRDCSPCRADLTTTGVAMTEGLTQTRNAINNEIDYLMTLLIFSE